MVNTLDKIERFYEHIAATRITRKDLFKSLFILGGSLILLNQTEDAYAHPPQDIIITYDPDTKILQAVIIHNVSNPEKHYIKKVNVSLNGLHIIEHKISKQDNNTSQTAAYLIPDAKSGDTVSVEAYCSISGEMEKQITLS